MSRSWLAALAVAGATLACGPAFSADESHMLDQCRSYAASHLHVSAGVVNVTYEGQRADGTHAVNGSAESSPPIAFQCSFAKSGKKIVKFVTNKPKGCPADVSEADRYKYPACN